MANIKSFVRAIEKLEGTRIYKPLGPLENQNGVFR